MRAALDMTIVAHAMGGVGRYTLGLARGLSRRAGEMGVDICFVDVPAARRGTLPPWPGALELDDPFYTRIRGLIRASGMIGLERMTRGARIGRLADADLYHVSGVQPRHPRGRAAVLTFFDPSALEHPEWHTPDTVRYAREEAGMTRRGAALLAISEWAAARARTIFGPGTPIGVAGGAADGMFTPGEPDPAILGSLGLEPRGYLLHVGNYVPRKNIPLLLEARALAEARGARMPLVLAGAGGWREPDASAPGVMALRAVSDSTMLSLYRGARALLLPSLYEGLGLPALEAMACGTGVVASDATALPETLAGCGLLLPPSDAGAWADAMVALMDGGLAAELASKALERPRPTWDSVAEAACGFYLEAAR